MDVQVERRKGTGLWRLSSPARDAMLVAEVQRNPSVTARDFKAATGYPGQKDMIISRLKAAGRALQPAVSLPANAVVVCLSTVGAGVLHCREGQLDGL